MAENDIELQSLINMETFEISEADLSLDLKKRLAGLKSSVKRYQSKPSEAQLNFVHRSDAILAHDIQNFAEQFHNLPEEEGDSSTIITDPMSTDKHPPVPPVEPPVPPVPPTEPPVPPVEPPVPPVPPIEPPAPPTPPTPPTEPGKSNAFEYLDWATGG